MPAERTKLKVLILDFDGVVIESNDAKTDAFRQLFSRFPEHADEMMAYHHANVSVTRFRKFERLMQLLGREGDAALADDLAADFSRMTREQLASVPLVPGALSFLQAMTGRLPVYLASVTPAGDLEAILRDRDLLRWFRAVYGCPPWTKTGAILDLLKREKAHPTEALLIGDSAGDQRAAREAGVAFVGRNSGLPFDPPPPTQFPDLTVLADYLTDRIP